MSIPRSPFCIIESDSHLFVCFLFPKARIIEEFSLGSDSFTYPIFVMEIPMSQISIHTKHMFQEEVAGQRVEGPGAQSDPVGL